MTISSRTGQTDQAAIGKNEPAQKKPHADSVPRIRRAAGNRKLLRREEASTIQANRIIAAREHASRSCQLASSRSKLAIMQVNRAS
jgi:hypothetical protein